MSRTVWIVNASPIILLAKIGLADLLLEMPTQLIIPSGVAIEIKAGEANDAATRWLTEQATSFVSFPQPIHPTIMAWDLGRGESEVISLAFHGTPCEVVLDDKAARTCASTLGISVIGTLGVLVRAKRQGRLDRVSPALDLLTGSGCRISPTLLAAAKQLAGET